MRARRQLYGDSDPFWMRTQGVKLWMWSYPDKLGATAHLIGLHIRNERSLVELHPIQMPALHGGLGMQASSPVARP